MSISVIVQLELISVLLDVEDDLLDERFHVLHTVVLFLDRCDLLLHNGRLLSYAQLLHLVLLAILSFLHALYASELHLPLVLELFLLLLGQEVVLAQRELRQVRRTVVPLEQLIVHVYE